MGRVSYGRVLHRGMFMLILSLSLSRFSVCPFHRLSPTQPIGWKGLAAIVAIGGAAVFYFEAERSRVEKSESSPHSQSQDHKEPLFLRACAFEPLLPFVPHFFSAPLS